VSLGLCFADSADGNLPRPELCLRVGPTCGVFLDIEASFLQSDSPPSNSLHQEVYDVNGDAVNSILNKLCLIARRLPINSGCGIA